MLKKLFCLLFALALCCSAALADMGAVYPHYTVYWIIEDSDVRPLAEEELWRYSRETLRYIRNEILARAGYAFESAKFYDYFNAKPWYHAGGYGVGNVLSQTAWDNIALVKRVEREMDKLEVKDPTAIDIQEIINYQNSRGGYGNQMSYGNARGGGSGLTLPEIDPAYSPDPKPYGTPAPRMAAAPRYAYTAQYIIPDSNIRHLTEGELWAYSRETLRYIRNEILARHGYTFDVVKFREYFTGKSWYAPGGYSDASLSTTEWDNVALIKQVERAMDEMGLTNMHYLDIETIKYQQQNGLCPPW